MVAISKKSKKEGKTILKSDPLLDWTLGEILGTGSFGEVFSAKSRDDEIVAIKCCAINSDDDYIDMKLEAEILINSDHKNILKSKAAYFYKEKFWMVLELCKGGALDDIVEKISGFDEPTIQQISFQVLNGLSYLHNSMLVIHRDIKAGNVMLMEDGVCKIADFGVSAKLENATDRRNTFIGTPYWMAPEVIFTETVSDQPYSSKVDIYSYGIMCIEMAESSPPNSSYNPTHILLYRLKAESPKLKEPGKWSHEFNSLIDQTLYRDVDKRLSADQCLQHPYINNSNARKLNKCIELYKISKAIDSTEEQVVEDMEEVEPPELDIDFGEGSEGPTPSSSIRKDVRDSTNSSLRQTPPKSVAPPAVAVTSRKGTKTITKTINIMVDGHLYNKTITRVVGEDNKDDREREKKFREELIHEGKRLKLEEQRDHKKLLNSQEMVRTDLLTKQKNEFEAVLAKYYADVESLLKACTKELEKKNSAYRSEQEKYYKKIKSSCDKDKKSYHSYLKHKAKSGSSSKYDTTFENPNYLNELLKTSFKQMQKFFSAQHTELISTAETMARTRHESLLAQLTNICSLRLNQVMEFSQLECSQIASLLEFSLQQKKKIDAREQAGYVKHHARQREVLLKQQQVLEKDLPRTQKPKFKKLVEAYRKSIHKEKVKNEKELIRKYEDKVARELEEEREAMKAKHQKELADFDEGNERQMREVIEYEKERAKSTHLSYQQSLYKKTLEHEKEFKRVLLNLSELVQVHDKTCQTELEAATNTHLEIFADITVDSF